MSAELRKSQNILIHMNRALLYLIQYVNRARSLVSIQDVYPGVRIEYVCLTTKTS